jgi:hypothetical protein
MPPSYAHSTTTTTASSEKHTNTARIATRPTWLNITRLAFADTTLVSISCSPDIARNHSVLLDPSRLLFAHIFHLFLTPFPVKQEIDDTDDFWADHDDAHGDPEHPDLMQNPDYAEGYAMACCGRRPYEPGCVVTTHVSNANPQGPNTRVRR